LVKNHLFFPEGLKIQSPASPLPKGRAAGKTWETFPLSDLG